MSSAMKYPSVYCNFIAQRVIISGTDNRCSTPSLNENHSKFVTCQFNILYFRATDYVRLYLLPTDCTSVGYNVRYCFSDMIRIIMIYILRGFVEDNKILYFYNSKISLKMATIISRNMSEEQ